MRKTRPDRRPFVDAETRLRVQTNLDANNARGERPPQKYDHYLKGVLWCAGGAKLMIEGPREHELLPTSR
ncbi:hypothetical protein MHJ63_01370 [Pseudoglutamicibacter albus]|uniref:hypothetical protein n=1 Tax=Pseudoglutamicibacter albus TaxID=98671 RepID=UPI001EF3F55D|nr:hypothetical protein [Pseudoglutamicibacter albus]MCG7303939.1 hypothetical protein [Pseudoglutamicibacter albus]